MAVGQIKHFLGGRVEIDSVDFKSRTGAVRLNYLVLGPEQTETYDNRVLRANKVDVRFSFFSVLMFKPKITSIRMKDYIVNVQYDSDRKELNLGMLNIAIGGGAVELPKIKCIQGILKVTHVAGSQDETILESSVEKILKTEIDWELKPVRLSKGKYAIYAVHHQGSKYGVLRGILDSAKGQVLLGGKLIMGQRQVFGNSWDMENIQFDAAYDKNGISISKLYWEMGDGSIDINCTAQWPKQASGYAGSILVKNLSIADECASNKLVYSPAVLKLTGEMLGEFFMDYRPNGPGEVDVEFSGQFGGKFLFDGTVTPTDVEIKYCEFPYLIEHLQGQLKVSQDRVLLDGLKCSHGQVDLNIDGFSGGSGDGLEYDVLITSENMLFDSDLYLALDRKQKDLWFTFTPSGVGGIVQRLRKKPGQEKTVDLEVNLDGASAVYEHFPYQLNNLTGKLIADASTLEFVNVVSAYDGKRITLNGKVTDTESERPQYNIVVNAENIPIDSHLKTALPARQRDFYEQFTVNALTDVEIRVFPNEVGRRLVDYIAIAEIRGKSLVYKQFPYPLNDVHVRAELTPDVMILREMTGTRGDGRVYISGKIWPGESEEDEAKACLAIEADGIELDDELLDSLPEAARKAIGPLNVGGIVNVAANMNIGAAEAECAEYKITINCIDANIRFEKFAWPIERITGRIELGANELIISLESVDTTGVKHGRVSFDSEIDLVDGLSAGGWFTIDANDVIIDDKFAEALSGVGSDIFQEVKAAGRMDLRVKNGHFFPRKDDGSRRFEVPIEAKFKNCSMGSNELISDLNANVSMHVSYEAGRGLNEANAKVVGKSLKLKGRPLSDLRALGRYEPKDKKFVCRQFISDCCGGKVTGQFSLDYPGQAGSGYMMQMVFDSLELERVVHAAGTGVSEKLYSGSANGDFAMSGLVGDIDSRIGRINIGVSDVKVTERSLAGKVLTAAKRNNPSDFVFKDMTIRSFIRRDELVFEQVLMSGSSTALRGSGKVNLDSSEIDLDFAAFGGGQAKGEPSMLESLAKGLGGAIVKVEVRGSIEEPTIKTTKLPVFKKPFEIFGEKK